MRAVAAKETEAKVGQEETEAVATEAAAVEAADW